MRLQLTSAGYLCILLTHTAQIQTVNTASPSRILAVDEFVAPILGQTHIRYGLRGWVALAWGKTVDQTVDHFTPVAGTRMRR